MTWQMLHKVLYSGETYELLGDSSGQLFHPKFFGFGFKPVYEIKNGKIYLGSINEIHCNESDYLSDYPIINGRKPEVTGNGLYLSYRNINQLLSITSTAFICRDVTRDYYVPHLTISDYFKCLRLRIETDTVIQTDDLSELCAEIRDKEQFLIAETLKIAREQNVSVIELFSEQSELRSLQQEVAKISEETYF